MVVAGNRDIPTICIGRCQGRNYNNGGGSNQRGSYGIGSFSGRDRESRCRGGGGNGGNTSNNGNDNSQQGEVKYETLTIGAFIDDWIKKNQINKNWMGAIIRNHELYTQYYYAKMT